MRNLRPVLYALGGIILILASCSSAPKAKTEFFEVKNKAAEYAKLGDGFMGTGQYAQAAKYYDEALQANSSVDNLGGVAASHASLGRVYLALGESTAAEYEFGQSLDYARMAGSQVAMAVATSGLGEVSYSRGRKEEALGLFEEAVVYAAKDERALAVALHDVGVAKDGLGRTAEAVPDIERAAGINQKLKRWNELAANRYVLASILAGGNKLEEAFAMAMKALEADKAAENGRGIAGDLAAAASLAGRSGRRDESWLLWRRSFDTALAAGDDDAARKALASLVALAPTVGKAEEEARYRAQLEKLDEARAQPASP